MSAKNFTLLTFGFFIIAAVVMVVFIFAGDNSRAGGESPALFFFAGFAIFLLGFFSFNRKWKAIRPTARYLQTFDSSITIEEGMGIFKKYSYLILLASIILFTAGVVSLAIS